MTGIHLVLLIDQEFNQHNELGEGIVVYSWVVVVEHVHQHVYALDFTEVVDGLFLPQVHKVDD